MSTRSSVVDDVRGFNRFYTRALGLLRRDLAEWAFGLTEARVLFAPAQRDDIAASERRRELDLDGGYLSRILSGFTASGLAVREKSAADGRRQVVRLAEKGPAGVRRAQPAAGTCNRHASCAVGPRSANSACRRDGPDPPNAEQRDAPVRRRFSATPPG
jgi:DNA-binding MarR family transcriptional regulator